MSKRWSKLQTRLYGIMEPSIKFQIHCALYEMNSNDGCGINKLPRIFITIGKDIVFDYPKEFDTTRKYGFNSYPWDPDISEIDVLIEKYIQCPRNELMKEFEKDYWGLADIFRVCDRRIGKRRLRELRNKLESDVLLNIIDQRLQ